MTSPGSPWNDLINIMSYLFCESDGPRTRLFLITVNDRRSNANQRGIGAVQSQRVINQIKLAPQLAGHDAAMRLVPVEDELLIHILADDVQVNRHLASIGNRQFVDAGLFRLPARGRQAVFGRVNAGARALASEVSDVKVYQPLGWRIISAIQVVVHAQYVKILLLQRPIGVCSKSGDLRGKIR